MSAIAETLTDDEIGRALADAHIPSLMLALVHLTGDLSLIRGDIKPAPEFLADAQDGIPEAAQARARELALEVLTAARDSGRQPAASLDAQALREMMDYLTGQSVTEEYVPFLTAELSMNGEDA